MSTTSLRTLLATLVLALASTVASAQVKLTFDAADRGPAIGPLHYGIFYEEINNAGDGGLYAELIRNRSFEDGNLDFWSAIGGSGLSKYSDIKLNDAQGQSLRLMLKAPGQGISNTGYWGINCVKGDTYTFSMWIYTAQTWKSDATISLADADGNAGATATVAVEAGNKWQKVTATMTAVENIPDAHFELTFSNTGTVLLDMVSLFPPTYKGHANGCRIDLAEKLEALKPAFVRFPGGCYIEGDGSVYDNRRFEWKKTIGPIEERPGHYNYNWGYPCTDGMGFHEFLQLSEDLDAEPLFVVNIGLGHGWVKDFLDIDEYIQEALDALEYCNGDINTTWGAKRAANGHPEPFNMRLMEIGNENYNFDDEPSDHYPDRYKAFYDAIKARYPEVTVIGNVEAWGTDTPSWRNQYHCEIIDEHYYRDPEWFEAQYNKYDKYDRSTPKVYVGEYAVTAGQGDYGNLRAALGEAVYMMGMERNSDHVIMNSYAPIFINEERGGGWVPDMIRFSHKQSYGTPSYWVQQLMPNNTGRQNVRFTEENNIIGTTGNNIALSSWSTTVTYDNVKVTASDGSVVFSDDFSDPTSTVWTTTATGWQRTDGVLKQTDGSTNGTFFVCDAILPDTYTLELDATKNSGAEGFLIGFNYADNNNYTWWNLGGWGNTRHAIQRSINGSKTDYDFLDGTITTGKTYHIKIEVDGTKARCYLDGELIHDIALPGRESMPVVRHVYASSTIDDDANLLIVKLVNTSGKAEPVDITLRNAGIDNATVTLLSSASGWDENNTDNPLNIVPTSGSIDAIYNGNKAVYTAPAYSFSIIRFDINNINYTDPTGKPATEEQLDAARANLKPTMQLLSFLHCNTALPTTLSDGTTIEWNFEQPSSDLNLSINRHSAILEVIKKNDSDKKAEAATLTATLTFTDGARGDINVPVTLAPADNMRGYLYTFMNPNYEITNYALAPKESHGKHFEVLLEADPIFDTEAMAPIEGGTRDSYLDRAVDPDLYLMATTDMSNIRSGYWNNHGMDLLRSTDLIHWESTAFDFNKGKSIFSDADATTDAYTTDEQYARINRVWAPQFIWDDTAFNGQGAYLVYYSLLSDNPGDTHDRMFYSYANREFTTLTQPRIFYDPGYAVIDADIVLNPYDGLYHMMIKREGATGALAGIYEYTSPALLGQPWTEVMHLASEGNAAVEGPTHLRRIDEDVYNLYYMRYDSEYSYKVVDIDHLGVNHGSSFRLSGSGSFQHGSIITINDDEYTVLDTWSKIVSTIKKYRRISDTDFEAPIAAAQAVIANNRTIADLAEALPAALAALESAYNDDYIDVTDKIVNPDFNANNGDGWTGDTFTATAGGVAEFWNKNFNKYQDLHNMPAGTYRLELQGFYRYGLQVESRQAHNDGTEQLNAHYYMNDVEGTFGSLYDTPLSNVPDNVSQANTAFNTNNAYHCTPIFVDLEQPGTLRIGLRKTKSIYGDWCCFDNFRLFYRDNNSGIGNVTVDNEGTPYVDVYSMSGQLLRRNVDRAKAVDGLQPGVYLVGTRKVVVK